MPAFVAAIFSVIPLLILAVVVGMSGPSDQAYETVAMQRAAGTAFTTGAVPAAVDVIGRTIPVDAVKIDLTPAANADRETASWRTAMIEQAIADVCVTLQAECGSMDVAKLWAFMPASSGLVTDLIANGPSSALVCTTATTADYAARGRYLMRNVVSAADLANVTVDGTSRRFCYSKPSSGLGCGHSDLVDLR
jgi:hypothetical protein